MDLLKFDLYSQSAKPSAEDWNTLDSLARDSRASLLDGSCAGSDFLGWLDLPESARADLPRMLDAAGQLREGISDMVVIGIGGSYLGARALLEAFGEPGERGGLRIGHGPEIHFAGEHLGGASLAELLRRLSGRDFAINVISKSGTTLEPSVAFRILRAALEDARGEDANNYIVATTDPERGALREMAALHGWNSFSIPSDLGGRFSVLSAVGLFPLAVAGLDVETLLDGASAERARFQENDSTDTNPAMAYAAFRNHYYNGGLALEVLATFEPELFRLGDWWAQLFGESEGKEGKGIFPAAAAFTTDLHSLGQYLQDGKRQAFETFLRVAHPADALTVPRREDDREGLNALAGRELHQLNRAAEEGTLRAHESGGMPILSVTLHDVSPPALGGLIWFFEASCALSALMMGLNPFDQPGVEAYKREMKKQL
ncbi:glucose-6-phosphate isomerase [bacterium]|nr:glucose-6-phosphate isomerase [bacterium]